MMGGVRPGMLGKVDEKGGFKQWQQQPSRKQQLLPVTDSHCCRLAQISRAASGVRHETMKAMPATGGVVSDRGWAHVHIVVHKMRARGRVLACAHAHACASACCVRPRGWHGRLICGAGVIGRRGLFGVRSQTGYLSLYIYRSLCLPPRTEKGQASHRARCQPVLPFLSSLFLHQGAGVRRNNR